MSKTLLSSIASVLSSRCCCCSEPRRSRARSLPYPLIFPSRSPVQIIRSLSAAKVFFALYPVFSNAYDSLNRQEYGPAEKYLQTILDIDPGNNLARYYLIQVYTHTRQPKKVLTLADQLLRWYPEFIQGHLSRGYAAGELKDYPAARSIVQPGT